MKKTCFETKQMGEIEHNANGEENSQQISGQTWVKIDIFMNIYMFIDPY